MNQSRQNVTAHLFAGYAISQGLQVVRLKLHSVADNQVNFYEHGFLQAICLAILLLRFSPQTDDVL